MQTIKVNDQAAARINYLRENVYLTSTQEKESLLSAMTDSIRLLQLAKDEEDLQHWMPCIENIQGVLCDYWELRRELEEFHL